MITIRNIMAYLAFSIVWLVAEAQAFVVESSSSALGRSIFEPDMAQMRKAEEQKAKKVQEDEPFQARPQFNYQLSDNLDNSNIQNTSNASPDIDYGIDNRIVLVDIDNFQTSVAAQFGKFVAVRVIEAPNTQWNFEKAARGLEFVKKEKQGDVLIMLYRTTAVGVSKLNFDLISVNGSGMAVVASKILEVRVI